MRTFFLAVLLASCGAVAAADLRVDPGANVRDGTLNVSPTVQGPAGGRGKLATTNISVGPQDRYRIEVRLLQGGRVVAEEEVRYPD
jgi:hypothetical protein